MVELLVHMSLERFTGLPVPEGYEEVAEMLSRILHQLRTAEANVEDTAEATLRAYEIISRLPNQTEGRGRLGGAGPGGTRRVQRGRVPGPG